MKRVAIIGSTGFIGTQALQVIEKHADKFRVVALTGHSNAQLLIEQARKFSPDYVGVSDETQYKTVRGALRCAVGGGKDCLKEAASLDCDIVLVAVVGCAGLSAVLAAIEAGHDVALANKESLVAAGALVMRRAKEKGVAILPVDSEHSAVWQCLRGGRREDLKRIVLTASGGPFYGKTLSELRTVTPAQAIAHPTWRMGKKISVDSATMMNKGLEIIEARWLFDTQAIDYIVHPQSVIHSMVEFCDGAVLAQLSTPDMRLPILSALSYPARLPTGIPPLVWRELSFLPPREDVFPLPSLCKRSLQMQKNASCILNAANEAAVALFLSEKISFLQIGDLAEKTLLNAHLHEDDTEEEILRTHANVYDKLMRDYT